MSILNNTIYYINSESRVSGTSSNFTYQIDIPPGSNFDNCCVLAMTIPRSYYLVRRGQNQATVTIDGVSTVFEVPLGNYSAINFTSALLQQLNVGTAVFSMNFNSITGKYTYTVTNATTVSFTFTSPSRLGHQMGFELGTTSFVSQSLVSTNVVDFISTSTLFLHSDIVQDQSSVLQEIYSDNTTAFSNLVYTCKFPAMYSKKLRNAESAIFTFRVTDENDMEVNLNGHDICVTLLLYRKESIAQIMSATV